MFYRTLCRLDLKYLVELLEQFLCLLGGNEFLGLIRHLGGQLDTGLVTLYIARIVYQLINNCMTMGKRVTKLLRKNKGQKFRMTSYLGLQTRNQKRQ